MDLIPGLLRKSFNINMKSLQCLEQPNIERYVSFDLVFSFSINYLILHEHIKDKIQIILSILPSSPIYIGNETLIGKEKKGANQ